MSDKTIYCGSGKKMKEDWIKTSLCLSNIPKEHIFDYQGKKYVKLNVNLKSEPDQYGKDVSVSVDTWKPESGTKDDLPF